ncbi:hypothetical protein ETW23_14190 [Leisingera sp. NJS201]|uniref:hypothetical protein n=1 Tax=Leisingera sp. NJS201 TaxID=2508306 RepID=UPI001070D74B|nr:hypothetical protein [Leisingera sp. NJS201]QBR37116.1 hypothetical protein ETW23_14190 [Leisingera sp. NJS201]
MSEKSLRFSDRAVAKALSRAKDEERLDAGEISPSELRVQNSFIKGPGLAKKKVGFSPKCRPQNGDKYFVVDHNGSKGSNKAASRKDDATD